MRCRLDLVDSHAADHLSVGRLDAHNGLGIEIQRSTPLTAIQCQNIQAELTARLSEPRLKTWDHRSGSAPTSPEAAFERSCGFMTPAREGAQALDGKPIFRSASVLLIDQPLRAVLSGNSLGTTMLVGQVEMWRGIKPGVDWSLLDRPAGKQ